MDALDRRADGTDAPRVTRLANGLTIATDAMASVETVSLGVWVGVGTRHEPVNANGVAHLVEHMLFKGTPSRSAFDISQLIEAVGGHLNAHTSREQTAYYAKMLREDAALALDIISDMVQRPLFDATELERERTVILQELAAAEDTPDDIIFDHLAARAFPDQALGRPVLGQADVIAAMPRERLLDHLRLHHRSGNIVVAAAGRIEHEWLVEMGERLLSELPSQPHDPVTDLGCYVGGEYRDERDLEQLHVAFGLRGVGYHHDDDYAQSVLATLLGGGMSSRLFQEVREKRGLAYSIYAFASPYADAGLFGIYAGCDPDQVRDLVPVVCDELVRAGDDITEEEVERAKAQIWASLLMALESSMSRTEQLGHQLLAYGRPIPTTEVLSRIAAVERKDVLRVAKTLCTAPPTLVAIGPTGALESYDRFAERLRP